MADDTEGRYVWVGFGERIALNQPGWWYNEREGWLTEKQKNAQLEKEAAKLDFYKPGETWNSQWHDTWSDYAEHGSWDGSWDEYNKDESHSYYTEGYSYMGKTKKNENNKKKNARSSSAYPWSKGQSWEEWDYVEEEGTPCGVNPPPPPAIPKAKAMPSSRACRVVPPRHVAKEATKALQQVDMQHRGEEALGVRAFTSGKQAPPEPDAPPKLQMKPAKPEEEFSPEPYNLESPHGAAKDEEEHEDATKPDKDEHVTKPCKMENIPDDKHQDEDKRKKPPGNVIKETGQALKAKEERKDKKEKKETKNVQKQKKEEDDIVETSKDKKQLKQSDAMDKSQGKEKVKQKEKDKLKEKEKDGKLKEKEKDEKGKEKNKKIRKTQTRLRENERPWRNWTWKSQLLRRRPKRINRSWKDVRKHIISYRRPCMIT